MRGDDARHLTQREREILDLVARGLGIREIGSRVYLSERTVKSYIASVLAKLNATDRTHAVAIALRMGLIDPTLDELLGLDASEPATVKTAQKTTQQKDLGQKSSCILEE